MLHRGSNEAARKFCPHRTSFFFIVCLLLTIPAMGQWNPQSSGTSETLNGVHMAGPDTGWVVGSNESILRTTDGGNNWNPQAAGGTGAPLYEVNTHDGMTSWVVGGFPQLGTMNGTLGYTTDGGNSWNVPSLSVPYEFTSVFFIDASEGWFVGDGGGTIYHSTDGGASWTDQSTGSYVLQDVFFISPSIGWISGMNGTILTTGDGGNNWSTVSTPSSEDLFAVHFADLTHGWAVGTNGTILHSSDGGGSWSSQTPPSNVDLYDVHFINSSEGWAVGANGAVFHTTDGGSNWSTENSNSNQDLRGLHFPADTIGWAVGANGEIIVRKASACQPKSSSIAPTACFDYTVPSGDTTYSTSGTYTDTLDNATDGGCDSIINIDLTIDTVNTNVTQISPTELQADASGASYQWLNCDSSFAVIDGETGQSFQASSNGYYAVEVTANGCTDTSFCDLIQEVGIPDRGLEKRIALTPNPTRGPVRVDLGEHLEGVTLRVLDLTGKVLSTHRFTSQARIGFRLEQGPGLYFIEIEDDRGRKAVKKVIKK